MRKFTKSILALALLLMGVSNASAKETVIASGVVKGWNSLPADVTAEIDGDGCLVITNPSSEGDNWDLQLHIQNGFELESGLTYKVNITYKVETEQASPSVTVALWGDWSNSIPKYATGLNVTDDFTTMNLSFDEIGFSSSGAAIMWQSRSVVGKIYIKDVEVIEVAPDTAPTDEDPYDPTIPAGFVNLINNGDFEGSVLDNFRVNDYVGGVKKNVAEPRVVADPSNASNNVINITSNDAAVHDYDSQLFVTLPQNQHFNVGDVIRLRMRVKAENKQSGVGSQFHNNPGDYVFWNGIGNISFKTVWTNFDSGEQTIDASRFNDNGVGPSRTIAFNLSVVDGEANNFYFDDIQLLVKRAPQPFTVTEASWGTYSFGTSVSFGDDVKAYAATYNSGSVVLNPISNLAEGNGVIINAPSGDYTATVYEESVAAVANDLKVSDGDVEADGTIYVLADKAKGIGFYKLTTGDKVPAGKAYLKIGAASAPEFLGFGDGNTTSINELNVKGQADGTYYNLAGQRVAQPTKGLYIVNGKKVIK